MAALTPQDKLKYSYIAFAICAIVCSIPQMTIQTFALFFSLAIIIAFYVLRGKWEKESFEYKEASTLIKSFWIWSLLYIVGILVAGGIISMFGDMTLIHQWTQSVVEGGAVPDEEEMKRMTAEYMSTNFTLIIGATIGCVLPSLIYAFWRTKDGISRLNKPVIETPDTIII